MTKNPKSVLIVDDEQLICWGLERIISGRDFIVTTVNTGAAALNEIGNFFYDSVFLDIKLPDINGFEVFKGIRLVSPRTKVVFLSGDDSEHNRRRAEEEGAFRFISKPFDVSDIRETLTNMFDNQGAE